MKKTMKVAMMVAMLCCCGVVFADDADYYSCSGNGQCKQRCRNAESQCLSAAGCYVSPGGQVSNCTNSSGGDACINNWSTCDSTCDITNPCEAIW